MKALKYLWNQPMQRRVSLMTTIAVALTVVLFSVIGYLTLEVMLHRTSQATAPTVAGELAGPAAHDIKTTGGLITGLEQPAGVVVEALGVDGRVLRTPGQPHDLVLISSDRAAAGPAATTVKRLGTRSWSDGRWPPSTTSSRSSDSSPSGSAARGSWPPRWPASSSAWLGCGRCVDSPTPWST